MLTPRERAILINKPFPVVRLLTTSYPHAGTLIDRSADDMNAMRRRIEHEESLNSISGIGQLVDTYGDF